ncbi:MAG: bifunctional diguanylate cyclase/phosphodiesterase [Saccharospirillaceae bacterium]|nr:bifunctional diguanylate cyclase/phosphodiesterase [Saccharospirillaceae bacterium]MCD8533149.1 bifunctional diguanylate cyclase/phosphodiesterase [Saccharospirillaceae bacterium]
MVNPLIHSELPILLLLNADDVQPSLHLPDITLQQVASLDDACSVWLETQQAVFCLSAMRYSGPLEAAVERVRLMLPEAPLVVLLEHLSDEDKLIRAGVQEVLSLYQAQSGVMLHAMRMAIARRQYDLEQKHAAHHDPLTGLPNRGLFQDRLDHCLVQSQRRGQEVSLLFVDLDRFRVVNELHGHPFGDLLLMACAQRLQQTLRRCDTVARLGGNGFAVILEAAGDQDGAQMSTAVAQKIRAAFQQPFSIGGEEIFSTVSIGIELASRVSYDAGQLVRHAELALHQAKREGRNVSHVFCHRSSPADKIRVGLESALHHALEREELRLVYQPQLSIGDQSFTGVEVLLRWEHPVLGDVSPSVFIPVLEETGLIERFGEWVLRNACHQYADWLRQGLVPEGSRLSVNLSPRQFRQRDLADSIQQLMADTGLPPQNLTLEITESTLMYNLSHGIQILNRLRLLGVSVAIDDFGTGYSSLAYLKDLPIDYLKIDRMFVQDIVTDTHDAAIASSIINLAHNLGLKVIAEGVEDSAMLDVLAVFGCDQYQGFYFARPLPADDIPALIARCA